MHVTPVKLLVRAVHWFTWRVGVRVGVSFLLLFLLYNLKTLICARHFSRLSLLLLPLFVGVLLLLGFVVRRGWM